MPVFVPSNCVALMVNRPLALAETTQVNCSSYIKSLVLYLVHPAGEHMHLRFLSWNYLQKPQGSFHFHKEEVKTSPTTLIPTITCRLCLTQSSHLSKCHGEAERSIEAKGSEGPKIDITSFLSIRSYLFPWSYRTSASDAVCIPGEAPGECRP